MTKFERTNFYGLSVDVADTKSLHNYILTSVDRNETKIFYGHAIWTVPMAKKHPEIYSYGEMSDVLTTDGRIFYLLCKLKGIRLKEEISIPQLVYLSLKIANEKGLSIFLLGATKEINNLAQIKILSKYSDIKSISGYHGFFGPDEHVEIIKKINQHSPNIVLIGISSPTKEIIAYQWKQKLKTNIIIPCGGMLDVLAEKTKLTPRWIKKLGFASFYRVLQEPRRLYKRYSYIYLFTFFNLIPTLIWESVIKRNKDFSIPTHYKII